MFRKGFIIANTFFVSTVILGGCSVSETIENTEEKIANKIASISIPFEWFRNDPEAVQEVKIQEVEGLQLDKEKVDVEGIVELEKKLTDISEALKDEDNFQEIVDEGKNVFNILSNEHLSIRYGEHGDDLTKVIEDIGSVPYQYVNSLTLRQYGVKLYPGGDKVNYAVVDVNAVNDTEDFHIHTLFFTLDEEGNIIATTKVGNPTDRQNTITPLTKDSLLFEDTHIEFQHNLQKIIQALSNPTIYEQISLNEIDASDTVIKSLTKKIGIESKNTSIIYSLIQHGKGTFDEWGITGYLYDDKDVNAVTFYELTVADEEGYHFYTIHYHRGLKEITNISKGSPFKEVFEQ